MLPTPAFNTEKLSSLQPFHVQHWGHNITSYTNQWCRRHSDFLLFLTFYTHSLEVLSSPSPEPIPNPTSSYHLHATSLVVATYLSLECISTAKSSSCLILASITTTVHRLQIRLLKCKPDHTPPPTIKFL